jgi:acetyl esterase/lipase
MFFWIIIKKCKTCAGPPFAGRFIIPVILLMGCSTSNNDDDNANTQSSRYWAHRYSIETDLKYGPDPDQRLDIYRRGQWVGEPNYWQADSAKHPTLIYIHGGGWLGGSKEEEAHFVFPYLNEGWNVVNVEYRKGENTAPAAVKDVMCAVAWVANNALHHQIDLDNIVISGASAGGHLALIAGLLNTLDEQGNCYTGPKMHIRAIVNWFGITDIGKVEKYLSSSTAEWNYARSWIGEPDSIDIISEMYSPVRKVSSESPSIITIHGEKDTVVPYEQAISLHARLNEERVRNELISIPDGKHMGFSEKDFQYIYTLIFEFLDGVIVK